jgi:predicted dehydrogenase
MDASTRRRFLKTSAAAMAVASYRAAAAPKSPNEKVNIAGVGIGGMGAGNLRALEGENIVALCDIDSEYAGKTFAKYPKATRHTDFRKMLEKQPEIDAVVIATPDHTHAVIAKAAMEAGKHVYCQKPLTHDVFEARRLAEIAAETGVVTQMGIQGHSGRGACQVAEWIQAGVVGEVREVDAWCDLSYYPWGHASWSSPVDKRPAESPPIPEHVDWDMWIGPAPMRPYHSCYHPRSWRSWWDFGCGMMGDRGAHTLDPIMWALDLGQPTSIDASSTGLSDELHPLASIVRYEFPAKGARPAVVINWYDGLRPPRPSGLSEKDNLGDGEGGAIFKGSKGYLTCGTYGQSPRLVPEARMKEFTPPDATLRQVEGTHENEWVDAIRNNRKANADFAYSGPLTEIALLGNIAKRMNTKLRWNTEKMEFTNVPKATEYVHQVYRDGWAL